VLFLGVLFAAIEEGVLRFGECLGGLWRLSGFLSHHKMWPTVGLEVIRKCVSSLTKADLVRSCALASQCVSFDSLSYRQELLLDFELNVRD
jgi:hypothetical protein